MQQFLRLDFQTIFDLNTIWIVLSRAQIQPKQNGAYFRGNILLEHPCEYDPQHGAAEFESGSLHLYNFQIFGEVSASTRKTRVIYLYT